jgi:GNAT superfamily N-acetyltransferase
MAIRPIEVRDIPELFDIRASTRENAFSREALREMGITEESVASALGSTHCGWLSESEGKKIGFAIGDGSTGEISVIAVLPQFEGQGTGARLLEAVESWLYSLKWPELWLWTSSNPATRAFSFYTKRGWVITEAKRDIVYMKKTAPNQSKDPTP